MVYKSLGYYSFCILITWDLIKLYENIMNFICKKKKKKKRSQFYLTIFNLYLEGFAILWLHGEDN